MGLAQRMKKGLTKMIPSTKVTYNAPAEKLQSTLSDAQIRKMRNKGSAPSYKVPKTPKVSGVKWGG